MLATRDVQEMVPVIWCSHECSGDSSGDVISATDDSGDASAVATMSANGSGDGSCDIGKAMGVQERVHAMLGYLRVVQETVYVMLRHPRVVEETVHVMMMMMMMMMLMMMIAFIQRYSPLSSRHALACDSTWVTSLFYSAFFLFKYPPKWCTYSAGIADATWICCRLGAFCVHHTTMHHVTSCKATYVRCMRV